MQSRQCLMDRVHNCSLFRLHTCTQTKNSIYGVRTRQQTDTHTVDDGLEAPASQTTQGSHQHEGDCQDR